MERMIKTLKNDDIQISESLMANPPWAMDALATIREFQMAIESDDDEDVVELLVELQQMGIDPDSEDYSNLAMGVCVGVGAWATFMAMAFADASDAGIDVSAAIMAKARRLWTESQE